MLRVLVVDDEDWVRRGIIEKAMWKALGAEVAAEARHGLEGLEKARECKPDIVITDMRMPVMDGAEFITRLHREYPETSVIVISGYSDYKYTRQALLNKVADYILKPVKKNDLNAALARIIEEHKRGLREKQYMMAMRESVHTNIALAKNKGLNRLIEGNIGSAEIRSGISDALGIPPEYRYLSAAAVMICNFRAVSDGRFQGNDEALSNAMLDVMEKAGEKSGSIAFRKDGYKHIFALLCGESAEQSDLYKRSKKTRIVKTIGKELCDRFGASIKAGTGTWRQGIENAHISFREAAQALNAMNLLSSDTMLHIEDIHKASEEVSFEGHLKVLVKLILYGDEANIQKHIRRISEEITGNGSINLKSLYKLRLKFLSELQEEMNKAGAGRGKTMGEDAFAAMKDIWTYASLEENIDWLYKAAASAAAEMGPVSAASAKQAVNRVIEYIQGHYAEKIPLSAIAENFYISKTYFCRIFKAETGKSFIDYLTGLRMEKAKELFDNYSMKVYEVAGLVGYQDVRHFSKLYKKHFRA